MPSTFTRKEGSEALSHKSRRKDRKAYRVVVTLGIHHIVPGQLVEGPP